ncbi:hypothetical protein [Mucilaginibacter sp.]|uniref:hypothetical protein n=1 Tax=Mucilaginibacter sp. TaxID=1882438 RepID=UPI00262FE7DB|nr:hypothetical protein [Mucilaginibacter sp.]MDB4926878.1 hypothetical protein [Mucilaginibacter sp.]
MKYLYILIAIFLLTTSVYAQKTGWKELDTFHEMVPKLLHTAASGDLIPIKKNSTTLFNAAKKWQLSKLPKGSDTPQIKTGLDELTKDCTELDNAVKAGKPDDDLKLIADKTHKRFHAILSEVVINN